MWLVLTWLILTLCGIHCCFTFKVYSLWAQKLIWGWTSTENAHFSKSWMMFQSWFQGSAHSSMEMLKVRFFFSSFLPLYKIWTVSICICHDPGFWTKHFSFGLSASVWCSFSVFSFSNIKLFLSLCFHSYSVCIVIFSVILQACFPSCCVPWV